MAKFLTGNELNSELEKIFDRADEQLILISPYIKLHNRYASTLKTKLNNHKLKISVVFGKNEEDLTRSMKEDDFNFFKEFPNIEIKYEKSLHAKYYANERAAILTSMNLYSYSQDNNIEAGVLTKATIWGNLANNLVTNVTGEESFDDQAWNYFKRVFDQAEVLFLKKPVYENAMLGLTKKYKESVIEIDKLSEFFRDKSGDNTIYKREEAFERKMYEPFSINQSKLSGIGYCIRTAKAIPFNPKRPLSEDAYRSWAQFENENFPEKYCHFSGEQSYGETTFAKPILRKNWNKAKAENGL